MKKICFLLAIFSAVIAAAFPATVTLPKTWVASSTIKAADLNANFQALASGINGGIDASNLAPGFAFPTSRVDVASVTYGATMTAGISSPVSFRFVPLVNNTSTPYLYVLAFNYGLSVTCPTVATYAVASFSLYGKVTASSATYTYSIATPTAHTHHPYPLHTEGTCFLPFLVPVGAASVTVETYLNDLASSAVGTLTTNFLYLQCVGQ